MLFPSIRCRAAVGAFVALAVAGFAGSVAAADLPTKYPVKAPAPGAFYDWTGFYVGLHGGYGWGSSSTSIAALEPTVIGPAQQNGTLPTSMSPRANGFLGGLQAGYNWQSGRTVVGVEADIAYASMHGDDVFAVGVIGLYPAATTTQSNKITWLGTLRPRLGFLVTPSTLVFATGGLAYGGVKTSTNIDVIDVFGCPAGNVMCAVGSASKTKVGWTLGAGFETALDAHWSAKVEYLYFDLGSVSYPLVSTATFAFGGTETMRAEAKFKGQIVRLGLNYRFN